MSTTALFLLCYTHMKLGSKKHLQNPKLPDNKSGGKGFAMQQTKPKSPKDLVLHTYKKKKRS